MNSQQGGARSFPAPEEMSKVRRWAAVAVLTASLLVITMDMTILNIALPEIAAELHPTANQQLWILDVYSLVLAGLLVSWASIGDRWGRKRMLMLGYTIFAVASLLVLWADSAEHIIAIRAFLGLGGAMIMPTTLSLIRVIFVDPKERATALGIWAGVSGIGGAVGPLVGGFLLEHFSWHAAFLVNIPLMVLGVIAGLIILPESRVSNPGKWDGIATLLSLVGMVSLVWTIKAFAKEASFDVPMAWATGALAIASLSWFVVRCLRSDAPLLELRLFTSRPFSAGIIAAFGSMFAMMAAFLLIAQWLQLVDGASPIEAGVRLIPSAAAAAIASLIAPPLARRVGARAVLGGGLLLSAVGMGVLALQPGQLGLPTVLVSLALVGAGTGSLAVGSALIMSGSPEEKAGNAGALEETSYELGGTLGIAILGSVSAIMFRDSMRGHESLAGLDEATAAQAAESLGGAVSIADQIGSAELASHASAFFVESLQVTGVLGGIVMLAVAGIAFWLTPKGTKAVGSAH